MNFLVFVLLITHLVFCVYGSPSADLGQLKSNLLKMFTTMQSTSSLDRSAEHFMNSMSSDGSWKDINYTDTTANTWSPSNHPKRLYAMTQAISIPNSKWYHNEQMHKAALTATRYWYHGMFKDSGNWFKAVIGVNKIFAPTCFLLNELAPLSSEDRAGCTNYMQFSNLEDIHVQDYTNLVWVGENILVNCVFWNNWTLANAFVTKLESQLHYTSGGVDGPKVDGSFFYHGSQEYIGAYGQSFLESVMKLVTDYLPGTSFQKLLLSNPNGLAKWLVESQKFINWPTNRHDMIDQGRAITRADCCGNELTANTLEEFSQYVPAPWKEEIQNYANRVRSHDNTPPIYMGNYHMWTADYVAHRMTSYNQFLRMASSRTKLMESCMNGENKHGQHITDGTLLTYFRGDEWKNTLAAFNWEQWPGTTVEQNQGFSCPGFDQHAKTQYVGGASYVSYGVTAMDFLASIKGTVSVKKGYFFFKTFTVLLGADISWKSKLAVRTTVDQRPLESHVYVNSTNSPVVFNKTSSIEVDGLTWVHHDRIGYLFPGNTHQEIELYAGIQKGYWEDIEHGMNKHVAINFLNLGLSHSKSQPTYEFVIVPDVNLTTFSTQVNQWHKDITIISNTASVQAVSDASSGITEVIFWSKGSTTILGGYQLSASIPANVIVKQQDSKNFEITVADPAQTPKATITLSLKDASQNLGTSKTIYLPTGDYAGSSQTIQLQLS
jgi:chondroitin AC lyase